MVGGFLGMRDRAGQVVEKGWSALGFPSETTTAADKGYEALRRKV